MNPSSQQIFIHVRPGKCERACVCVSVCLILEQYSRYIIVTSLLQPSFTSHSCSDASNVRLRNRCELITNLEPCLMLPHAAEAADNKWQLQLFVWFLINAFAQCLSNYAFGAMPPQRRWQLAIGNPPRQTGNSDNNNSWRISNIGSSSSSCGSFILQDEQ